MTQGDLQTLFSRPQRPQRSVLSVYLNVDQSQPENLNRGFEKHLKDMIASTRTTIHDAAEMERFSSAAHHVADFVSAYHPHARSLAVFFDAVDGFFWPGEVDIAVQNQARWDNELFSQPFVNALDQFEQYGVVLVDRSSLRLFAVFLGGIQEFPPLRLGSERTRHIKTAGTDHIASASRLQRKADERVRTNLHLIVKAIDSFVQANKVQRLVLAGTPEIAAELREMLPKRLSLSVIGIVGISADASDREVLAATLPIAEEYERSTEVQIVRDVVTAAAKDTNAVVGLGHTLRSVNSKRVWQLIYAEGFKTPGFECPKCAALFSLENTSCHYCGTAVQPVNDVVERAVEHAVRNGSKIEVVTGDAAASLIVAGSIGAFLKTRTTSLRA